MVPDVKASLQRNHPITTFWGMKRRDRGLGGETQDDVTDELVGHDAAMDEAAVGDAGSGASPFGGDFTGGYPTPIQDPPDDPSDIAPDRVERWPGQMTEGEEEEITARPSEEEPLDPGRYP